MLKRTFWRAVRMACVLLPCAALPALAAKVELPQPNGRILPATIFLVGTYDEQGRPDASVIDRAGMAGAVGKEKSFVYISVRPSRQTARNIDRKGAFTLNVPSRALLEQSGFCGSVSAASGDRYIDKFAIAGLTPVKGSQVDAPMVEECPISMECTVIKTKTFGEGSHTMYIAEVKSVWIDENVLNGPEDKNPGHPNPVKVDQIVYYPGGGSGSGYYAVGRRQGAPGELSKAKFPEGIQ